MMRDYIIFTALYRVVLFKLGHTDGIQDYFVATFKVSKLIYLLGFKLFCHLTELVNRAENPLFQTVFIIQ